MSLQSGGGGGFGDVARRDPAAVSADVEAGRISVERARDVYGVEGLELTGGEA
jgi:N-methylhydantoinase B